MPSVLAIVSKAIFERDARIGGRLATVGDTVPFERYVSKNKGLAPLAQGGALFLVTVRPPDENLWLVAILESPTFDGADWVAAMNTTPITDVSAIKDALRFATGAGIIAKKGALGMSLQTPRVLTADDEALLRGANARPAAAASAKGHLNAHEASGTTPCLCRRCIDSAPEKVTIGDLDLVRDRAEAKGKFIWYWRPTSLDGDRDAVRRAVEERLHARANAKTARSGYDDLDEVLGQGEGDD